MGIRLRRQYLTYSFRFLLILRLIFPEKVAIMIAARAASSSESIYNVKYTRLYLKRLTLVFEKKIILFLSNIYIIGHI